MPAKLKIFLERGYVIYLNKDKNKSIGCGVSLEDISPIKGNYDFYKKSK